MFSKLISRNSKRSRKENGLFFSSLIISIVAFYIILALSQQDVMIFLKKMESDAVNRLLTMIPLFYGMTLFILFFLIYYASKFQLERRRHEFGVYLMMGMRRGKLFFLLLAEDLRNSITALLIGLPSAILLSELISLITARLVGIGIIDHQMSFSPQAMLWTAVGFLAIKLAAFLILSVSISRQEIGSLLVETPEEVKKQKPAYFYGVALILGICCLIMTVISEMNQKLDAAGLSYESYLQNMGRQLFYMVAASYITIYLAIIFLIIANTIIGVQFLMGQQKSGRRYRTLIHLGATYEILCQSAKKQINWYFGIPTAVATVSSLFGVRALFSGLLSSRTQSNMTELMLISCIMILALCVVEYLYIAAVKRSSSRYLLTLMEPRREE